MDRTKVTFAQAEGREPLPAPLRLGELSKGLRAEIWVFVYRLLSASSYDQNMGDPRSLTEPWSKILETRHVGQKHAPLDEYTNDFIENAEEIKHIILKGDYIEVFDFLQFVMRLSICPYDFKHFMKWALDVWQAAYQVIDEPRPTSFPGQLLKKPRRYSRLSRSLKVNTSLELTATCRMPPTSCLRGITPTACARAFMRLSRWPTS